MSEVIFIPDPARLKAGREAVRQRAARMQATPEKLRQALGVLFREMRSGRSTAAAVALANSSLLQRPAVATCRTSPGPEAA